MALYVNTNVSSINGQRKLTNATNSLNTTYQRLSSGLRINSAKDDAAGLQISDRLTSQINGLNQGNRNSNDGIALAQTIEGAMEEMTNMMQRIRVLAVQASNCTNSQKDREALQQEVRELSFEISRIACRSTFAGEKILAGVTKATGGGAATANGLVSAKGTIVLQVGANSGDILTLTGLSRGFTLSMIASAAKNLNNGVSGTKALTKDANKFGIFDVSEVDKAQNVLSVIDSMILVIDQQRAHLGAMQNRLESTIRNQASISENESDARSRIRDTDFAEETANLTQQQIIQQASQSILTQANQKPQIALALLGR